MATTEQTYLLGFDSTLAVSTTSGGTFTPINSLSKVTYGADKVDYIDVTNLNSPAGVVGGQPRKQFAPGLITPGDVTCTGTLLPGGDPGQVLITASFDTQTPLFFKHTFAVASGQTTGAVNTFTGFISSRPTMDASLTEAVSFNFSIKQTGAITYTSGS